MLFRFPQGSRRVVSSPSATHRRVCARLCAAGFLCVMACPLRAVPQQESEARYRRLAQHLVEQRLAGGEEKESVQEEAFLLLDEIVLRALNAAARPNTADIESRLAVLAGPQPAVGENFRLAPLGTDGADGPFALVVNLGLGGPSAVRLYARPDSIGARAAGRFQRSARIDRFVHPDFFDETLELVPAAGAPGLFVTVSGRTDDLATGMFTAWQFDGTRLRKVWASDMLQQSRYEPAPKGILLNYCAQADEARPRVCVKMVRERYEWDGAAWRRAEQKDLPVPTK